MDAVLEAFEHDISETFAAVCRAAELDKKASVPIGAKKDQVRQSFAFSFISCSSHPNATDTE